MRRAVFLVYILFVVSTSWGDQVSSGVSGEKTAINPWASYLNSAVDTVKQIYFITQDTHKVLFQSPAYDGYVNFNLAQGFFPNPASDRSNPTIYFGWNVLSGGAQERAGEAQIFDSWEHHFVPEEGKTLVERHWIFGDESGKMYRPVSSSMQVENKWVDVSVCADKIVFFSKDAATKIMVLQAIGSIVIESRSLAQTINDHYAYRINQTDPAAKEIQVTYAMGGANKWIQRIMAGSYDYSIYNPAWGHAVYIKNSDGNIGIGKINPTAKLDVNGGVKAKTLQIGDSTVYISKQKFIRRDTLFEVVNSDTFYMLKKGDKSGDTVPPAKESYNNALMQNYPNPLSGSTSIEYRLAKYGQVKLDVYNTLGQKVRTLVNREMAPGIHVSVWDGKDNENRNVSAGIYIYKLEGDDFNAVQKMVLVR